MKSIAFVGSALDGLREFSPAARQDAGHQLYRVQRGLEPDDWKPMTSVGPGVREIRVRDEAGAFRVIYVATRPEAVSCCMPFRRRPGRRRNAIWIWLAHD